ncbi:hypothetical protein L9F63_026049, partial [Diploptera punctata]
CWLQEYTTLHHGPKKDKYEIKVVTLSGAIAGVGGDNVEETLYVSLWYMSAGVVGFFNFYVHAGMRYTFSRRYNNDDESLSIKQCDVGLCLGESFEVLIIYLGPSDCVKNLCVTNKFVKLQDIENLYPEQLTYILLETKKL